jgi:hypothetical protein
MEIRTIGIDLGKTVFHLAGLNARGEVVVRKKCSRTQLLRFTSNLRLCLIGMEACAGSHFLGRSLREQGHDVRPDASPVCEAVREDEQERLHRCRSHRRSCNPSHDALCVDQKR